MANNFIKILSANGEEEPHHTKMNEEKYPDHSLYHNHHDHDHPPPPNKNTAPYGRSPKCITLAFITTSLILAGIAALVVWLVYRPENPRFTVITAAIYSLNTTVPPFITTTMQLKVLISNPNRRTSIYYDDFSATVYYMNQAITPPVKLPPFYHERHSNVAVSLVVGGGGMVPVSSQVMNGIAADEGDGMMALRLVFMGKVRYKAGAIRTGHYGFCVRCDLLVGLKKGYVGQVPLLRNPECKVDA
ncbi:hypothetical protein Ancab_036717 [Ancistrocladus abbreviatus]